MTIKAAGIMLLHKGPKGTAVLFLQRRSVIGDADTHDHPGEWNFPGGSQEPGETLEECALRETREEIGPQPFSNPVLWTRRIGQDCAPAPINVPAIPCNEVDFTTYIAYVKDQFIPKLDEESQAFAWASPALPPEPLHPGCCVALARLTMDELGVARAIAAGELTSPQRYENIWLFNIRITGTGAAFRHKHNEHVWRDSSLYLTDDFLARCNGLPVIIEHPEGDTLTSKEYKAYNVGSVFVPYLKADEVWAVVKVWDEVAAEMMQDGQLSTSPAVVFRDPDVNTNLTMEDGSSLLIEGKPSLLDHIAICYAGVWDKGGKPTGIENNRQDDNLSDPKVKWDYILSKVNQTKLDSLVVNGGYYHKSNNQE